MSLWRVLLAAACWVPAACSSPPLSTELSFDGDIWDFSADRVLTALLQGNKAYSRFGYSVSVHDNKMIVGAVGANSSMGGAYIYYRHEDEIWRLDKYLTLDEPVVNDQFGCAVAIYDYTIVVGANLREADNGEKTDAGAAYIYEKYSGRWEMTMDLTPDDVTAQDYFGSAVGLHLNTTVIGCWGCDSMGSFSGAAYIYSRWDGDWQYNEKIFANNGARYNWFGISVAVADDVVIVGATGITSGYTLEKAGGAYVFCNKYDDRQYDGQRFVECAELLPGDGRDGDVFGTSVAVHNGVVVVGAPMANYNGAIDAGAVYMYYRDDDSDWHFLQKMNAFSPSVDGHYGKSVAIHNDIVVVGGYNASGSGAVYIYGEEYELSKFEKDTNAEWHLAFILTPDEEIPGDYFGYSVALHDATVVVGSYGLDTTQNVNGIRKTFSHAGGVFSYYGGTSRIDIPHTYDASNSGKSNTGMAVGVSVVAFVSALSLGSAYLFYNKRKDGNSENYPISDWLPSSFSKAFGADGDYSATNLDSSHGISSSHGMISPDGRTGGVNNSSALASGSNSGDHVSRIFEAEDEEMNRDQQLLDDSLSKFQLKRQNRISIKKKKQNES